MRKKIRYQDRIWSVFLCFSFNLSLSKLLLDQCATSTPLDLEDFCACFNTSRNGYKYGLDKELITVLLLEYFYVSLTNCMICGIHFAVKGKRTSAVTKKCLETLRSDHPILEIHWISRRNFPSSPTFQPRSLKFT